MNQLNIDDIEQKIYEQLCHSCWLAKKCHDECETCSEFDYLVKKAIRQAKRPRPYKNITKEEKRAIYDLYVGNEYYVKDILSMFHISKLTLRRIVDEEYTKKHCRKTNNM